MTRVILLISIGACLLCSTDVSAQAYCALRDPIARIYHAWPDTDGHRSITRTVRVDDREAIADLLPFTIHFDELGRHTLYVVLSDGDPIGLVHVRSERGRYGLVEIAWSLNFDGTIVDVELQRCRDSQIRSQLSESLRDNLKGADVSAVVAMLEDDHLSEEARLVLQSGVKTLLVTDIVWSEDLAPMRANAFAASVWPDGSHRLHRRDVNTEAVSPDSGLDVSSIMAWDVLDRDGEVAGGIVRSGWRLGASQAVLWCTVDKSGRILDLQTLGAIDPHTQLAFAKAKGVRDDGLSRCEDVVSLTMRQLLGSADLLGSAPGVMHR